ncbi:MAG: hypothetical protein IPF57_00920 [Gammaproteobacteria bacterium]|jgi:hypothetical protein|nr:hypothetical protein [Gammaproteobacteria bacterium]
MRLVGSHCTVPVPAVPWQERDSAALGVPFFIMNRIDGQRTEITPDKWVSTRDHSWGVRYGVGQPPVDVEPVGDGIGGTYEFFWSPIYLERPDGSHYALFLNYSLVDSAYGRTKTVMSAVEHSYGRVERIVDIEPELNYDPINRNFKGGTLVCTMADGSKRR